MKTILLISSLLLLTSCQQYEYHVTYEKCNGQTGGIIYYDYAPARNPYYSDGRIFYTNGMVNDICDYSFTSNPIE